MQQPVLTTYNMPKAPADMGNVSNDLRHAPRRRNGKIVHGPAIKAKVNRKNKDIPAAGSVVKRPKEDQNLIPDFRTWVKDKKPIQFKPETPVKSETPVPLQPGAGQEKSPTLAATLSRVVVNRTWGPDLLVGLSACGLLQSA